MPDISDQEMETLLKHGVAQPTVAQKVAGFGLGAAEAYNPLNILHSIETIGHALVEEKDTAGMPQPQGPFGIMAPTTQPISKSLVDAEKKTITPDLSVKGLISKIPGTQDFIKGIPQSYETAGGLAAMAVGAVTGAKGLIKGSILKQAANAESNVIKDIKFLANEPEGPIMDAILQRPEKVAELFKQQKFGVDDLASVVSSALEKKGAELGKKVGTFRAAASADKTRKINTKGFKEALAKAVQDTTLEPELKISSENVKTGLLDEFGTPLTKEVDKTTKIGGGELFSGKDKSKIAELESMMAPENISPRDALLITDWIDNNTNYNAVASGNISRAAANAIGKFRGELKKLVRRSSKDMQAWAKADDEFSTFATESEGLADKFTGDGRVNAVNSLLNPSKDPIKQRLTNALNIGSEDYKNDPLYDPRINQTSPFFEIPKKQSEDFFNALAERRAAQGMKALDVTKVDPIRDQTNRVYQKWIKFGERAGQAIGSGIGALVGAKGGAPAAAAGSIMGISPGGFAGRVAVDRFARSMASPERLLKKAMQAKELSKKAKELATDLSFLQQHFGVDGANILVNAIKGSVPAINELSHYLENK